MVDAGRLNSWLTLGANVGVLIGLGLVFYELVQNRELMQAQTRDQIATALVELQIESATDQQLVELLQRADDGVELTKAEERQIGYRFNALIRYWENVHYQYRRGLYDEVEFESQREAWRQTFEVGKAITRYWCRMRSLYSPERSLYSPEFATELDRLLLQDSCRS